MTDPTPTTPTPAEGLTDEQLFELAADALGYVSIRHSDEEHPPPVYEASGSELIAYARAAIAADRAARHQHQEENEDRRWTEGICGNGAAILFDGAMVPIEEVVRALNRADRAARPAPTPKDIEAQFRAWWAESYPSAPAGPPAVTSHVAFALHLFGRGVQ